MRIAPDLSKEFAGSPLLYRALLSEEVEAGCVLIPRAQGPFAARSRGRTDGSRPLSPEEAALRQHQWRQRGFPSRGVSTTPHLDRARRYAEAGVIVELDRRLFEPNWIREFSVNEVLARFPADIAAPEDEEVILVCELEGPFPSEIVRRVIRLDGARTLGIPSAPREVEDWSVRYARGEVSGMAHGER
ncbi:MAG TPA: hypothetical protein VJ921_08495 [Vicinamibacteria bacterium]|nr:hypothetical protein [Vicinamibacteria bacterium]